MNKKKKLYYRLKHYIRVIKIQMRHHQRLLAAGIAAAALVVAAHYIQFPSVQEVSAEDLTEGVSYIMALEAADTASIEQAVQKIEKKEVLESGELNVWQQFQDAAIMGDSRSMDFSYYGYVEENRVFAKKGATILNIKDHIKSLQNLNPSKIFLCYGVNDILSGVWGDADSYIQELDNMLNLLHENLENASVYVNSILPALDFAFEQSPKLAEIPEWNQKIKQHCLEQNIPYIDLHELVEEYQAAYEQDGIHMKKDFYEPWAIYMLTEVNENE